MAFRRTRTTIPGSTTAAQDPKTRKLRGYLDAQKNALKKGAPPTKTTTSLEAILDEKPKKRKNTSIGMTMTMGNKSKKVHQSKSNSQSLKPRKVNNQASKSEQYKSIWSKVNVNDKKIEQNNAVSSASIHHHTGMHTRTLDDLLGPVRPKSASLKKRPAVQKSKPKKISKRKSESGLNGEGMNSKSYTRTIPVVGDKSKAADSTIVNAISGEDGDAVLSSRIVLNLPKARKKSLKFQRRVPSLIQTQPIASKGVVIQSHNGTTSSSLTSDLVVLPPISVTPVIQAKSGPVASLPKAMNTSGNDLGASASTNFTPHEAAIVPLPPTFAEKSKCPEPQSISIPPPGTLTLPYTTTATKMTFPKPNATAATYMPVPKPKKKNINNDNFVRLNLKNNAGACKGARSLKQHNRMKLRRAEWKMRTNQLGVEEADDIDGQQKPKTFKSKGKRMTSIHAAIDPLDDFLDGTFHAGSKKKGTSKKEVVASKHPLCPRHQRPCKLLTVKKNTTGNKGRKFYACSLPRGEQCDFFHWEDDTVEAAQKEMLQSSSNSGFIARQVAAHVDRLKTLTLPELRVEAKNRGLLHTGKKKSVLVRLSVWVRDIVSNAHGIKDTDNDADRIDSTIENEGDGSTSSDEEELAIMNDADSKVGDSENESDSSEDELEFCEDEAQASSTASEPMTEDNELPEIKHKSALHKSLKDIFGHADFREGQEWAIRRCLSQKKSLLVAPTGQGKSLCYALPAVLMDGVCIVISPLVSLMEDQLRHLPPSIPAATLSGNLSAKKMATIIDDLLRDRLKILFMSPERLASAAFRRLLRPKRNTETNTYERQLPKVSLLCVDEAHCLSQWGHNFRVSYLRLRSLLSKLEPASVLALTATAGPPVIHDICHTLHIPTCNVNETSSNGDGFIESEAVADGGTKILSSNRDNIDVAVKFTNSEEKRLTILLKLLLPQTKESSFRQSSDELDLSKDNTENPTRDGILSNGSVIIYVWRQKDADLISGQLKEFDVRGGIVCYHGGMDSNTRTKSQGKFMRGKARICVATVAFGLGINKADVRGVIHLCLPPSPEHHLQEIGRAGRDGNPARAIALVLEKEVSHKLSLSFSDRISQAQIHALLLNMRHLTEGCLNIVHTNTEEPIVPHHFHLDLALPITPLVQATDCKEESIQTILSILEDISPSCGKLLDIEGIIPDIAIVTLKRRSLEKLGALEEIANCIQKCGTNLEASPPHTGGEEKSHQDRFSKYGGTASEKGFSAYSFGVFEFSVVKCANMLGPHAEPRHVYAALRRLQNCGELELNFNDLGRSIHIRLNAEGLNLFREEQASRLDNLSKDLCKHFEAQDDRRAKKVLGMYHILCKVSNVEDDKSALNLKKSKRLETFQDLIHQHFDGKEQSNQNSDDEGRIEVKTIGESEPHVLIGISTDVNNLLQHPSLKKDFPGFPHSMKFGDPDYDDYTALVITKILHGIQTPRAPVLEWFRHPLWGKWREIHFHSLKEKVETLL